METVYCYTGIGSPEEICSPVVKINVDNSGLDPINSQIPSGSLYYHRIQPSVYTKKTNNSLSHFKEIG